MSGSGAKGEGSGAVRLVNLARLIDGLYMNKLNTN